MQVQTALLGELNIEETDIIAFPEAIPGFPEEKGFILIPLDEESPFYYLQSVKTKELCLIIANPFIFFPKYEFKLDAETISKLEIDEKQPNIAIYTILTISEDFKKTTANLLGPVIININNKKGLQFISQNNDYNTKHFIFPQNNSEDIKPAAREGL